MPPVVTGRHRVSLRFATGWTGPISLRHRREHRRTRSSITTESCRRRCSELVERRQLDLFLLEPDRRLADLEDARRRRHSAVRSRPGRFRSVRIAGRSVCVLREGTNGFRPLARSCRRRTGGAGAESSKTGLLGLLGDLAMTASTSSIRKLPAEPGCFIPVRSDRLGN